MATTVVTDPPKTLVRDPICGMEFNPAGAAAWRILDGQTYYFCAERCARQFERQHPGAMAVMPAPQDESALPPTRTTAATGAIALPGWVLPAIIGAVLLAVVAVRVFGVSPGSLALYAMVLACPLVHIVMMRSMGHGGHGGHGASGSTGAQDGHAASGSQRSCH